MEILTKTVRVKSLGNPFRIYCIGDVHEGELGCDDAFAREFIKLAAKDDDGLVIVMGDMGEFIATDDKRWDPLTVAEGLTVADLSDWGSVIAKRITSLLWPVRDKIVGYIPGNHEETHRRRKGHDIVGDICSDLGCPKLAYYSLIRLVFQAGSHTSTLQICATHGRSGATTETGRNNALAKVVSTTTAPLVLMGHVHAMRARRFDRLEAGASGAIHMPRQLGVITGTYLYGYRPGPSGYVEERCLEPQSIGSPIITVIPSSLHMTVDWHTK